MTKKSLPQNIINPFSERFLETWDIWKGFRAEYDKFKYKGVFSEQMALKKLSELSGGIEDVAVAIIEQSISRQWTGFYQLKNVSNGATKQPITNEARTEFRGSVQAELEKRLAGRG